MSISGDSDSCELSGDSDSHFSKYAAYFLQDIQSEKQLPLEAFCECILDFDTNIVVSPPKEPSPEHGSRLDQLRENYCRVISEESARYKLFCEFVNHIFSENDLGYALCTNATRRMLTLVWRAGLSGDNVISIDGPTRSSPHFAEVVSFFDFNPVAPEDIQDALSELDDSERRQSSEDAPADVPIVTPSTPTRNILLLAPPPPNAVYSSDEDTSDSVLSHCASYALQMMLRGFRQHVIGFLVTGTQIEFLYYDRSILLRSEPLDFIENWKLFGSIMAHIGQMDLAHWGFHNLISDLKPSTLSNLRMPALADIPSRPVINMFNGCNIQLEGGRTLILGDIVHLAPGLRGRGTLVVKAKVDKGEPFPVGNLVVKLSWPSSGRTLEGDILRVIEKAIGPKDNWVRKHLPQLLYDERREDDVGIQQRLFEKLGEEYEKRTLYIQVFEELSPITDFDGEVILGKTFLELVKCHNWVYDVGGVLHRDISIGNWMYRKSKSGDEVYGVLNDFDLATERDPPNSGPTSLQRTGTRTYMAIDLLQFGDPPPHWYRHDLESFFYLLFDVVHDPFNPSAAVASWRHLSTPHLVGVKVALFIKPLSELLLPEYRGMATCLFHIQDFFLPYIMSRRKSGGEDKETIGGAITGEKIVALLERHLPGLPVPPPAS